MLAAVYENIIELLKSMQIEFEEIDHSAVSSTDESAKVRSAAGWTEGVGSKNIVYHAKGNFYLVVTVASKNIKARKFKKEFGTKNIRFATPEEVAQHSGATPGAIPPFGHTHPELPIFVDKDIFDAPYFMFNPAIHSKSIRLRPNDLIPIYQSLPNTVKLFSLNEEGIEFESL